MELKKLEHGWEEPLKTFLLSLAENQEGLFFFPHPADEETIHKIALSNGEDFYLLLVDGGKVCGYGLLRGWDEGYSIPSLGLAIHQSVRGAGFGRALMYYLHAVAKHRGAKKIRLRVHKRNLKAISLYKSLNYAFEVDAREPDYLVGFKKLEGENRV